MLVEKISIFSLENHEIWFYTNISYSYTYLNVRKLNYFISYLPFFILILLF